jgi:hypothetical protein
MTSNPEQNVELTALRCPSCGGALESGFLLGQYSRLRWSAGAPGMTILQGVPLAVRPKRFWLSRDFLFRSPNLPAARCAECKVGLFGYTNDATEVPGRDAFFAHAIFGFFLSWLGAFAILVRQILIRGGTAEPYSLPLLIVGMGLMIAGVVLAVRGIRRKRQAAELAARS